MLKLDKKDHLILFELDRNSRQSINELAQKTKLSRDIVAYRVKQLEQRGIIQKYITIIDFSKFVYNIIRLYLRLQRSTPEIEEQIITYFVQQKNTLTVYKIDGHYNLAVGFLVKDLHTYQLVYEEFLKQFKPYIAEKYVSVFLDYVHYHHNYLVEKKYHDYTALSTGSFIPFQHDEKDIQLLNAIKENSRISLLELSQKLKMTSTGIRYKLKNLEKNKVIVAYKLLLDTSKLGYEYYKVDLELEDINVISFLKQFITQHPNVIYRDVAVGGSDFEFDCEFQNQQEFYRFIDEIKSLVPQKIRNYLYYKAIKIYKYSYFPEEIT